MGESARVWTIIVAAINAIGEKWMSRAVSENDLRTICAECSAAMRRVADEEHHDLTGWEIRVWSPDNLFVEGSITLVAFDGVHAFDLSGLAAGGYGEDPSRKSTARRS